jgi:hypothetical protein
MKTFKNLLMIASVVLFSLSGSIFADAPLIQWEKTFGGTRGDGGRSVQQTSDGGFIIAGGTSSFGAGSADVYLIKTDSSGNQLWQKTFGGSGYDAGYSVQQTTDGGYIIAGNTQSFGTEYCDVYLIKTNSAGTLSWQKTFRFNKFWAEGHCVQQTTDGGYIIVGHTWTLVDGDWDVYLIKTDSNGNLLWQKTFPGTDIVIDMGESVQQTTDGGYIIAGSTHSFGAGDSDVYLIKTNPNGNLLWQKTFGGASVDGGMSVQQTIDGGYIIAGQTWSFGAGSGDVYLIKTNSSGNLSWQKTFGGVNDDMAWSVQQTTDGGYIIAGSTEFIGAGNQDVYFIKTDPNGILMWEKTFGRSDYEEGRSVQQTIDGGYIIVGTTFVLGTSIADIYMIKLSRDCDWAGDFNCDGAVNFEDLGILTDQWLQPPSIPSADIAPAPADGIVNFVDFSAFAEDWLKSLPPPPGQASNPSPPDGATGVGSNSDLSWTAGAYATSHDVYFGTQSPGIFRGKTMATTYDPGTLASSTQYYWRIDEVSSSGKTTGIVWSFTTAGKTFCFPGDTLVCVDGGFVQISTVSPNQSVGSLYNITPIPFSKEIEKVEEHEGIFNCYDLILESGECISVADNHYFLLDSDLWVSVHELTRGSRLQSFNGPIAIESVVKRATPLVGKVYNLKIKDSDRYFVGKDGVIVRDY